jgi:hypothetical protein
MKTKLSEEQLEQKIEVITKKLVSVGEMYPSCKCKNKENPEKHGPYSNLNFTFNGKSRTKFLRQGLAKEFIRYTANYKKFKEYTKELIGCNIELINLRSKQ